MKHYRNIPVALQIVAILFLLEGISSVVGMIVCLFAGRILFDLGFLCIPAFFGLRRFSRGWRTFALVCIWIELIGSPIAFIVSLVVTGRAKFQLFGISIGEVPPPFLSIMSAIIFILGLWQYSVLTRPNIRALFYLSRGESQEVA